MYCNTPSQTEDTFLLCHSLLFAKSSKIPLENLLKISCDVCAKSCDLSFHSVTWTSTHTSATRVTKHDIWCSVCSCRWLLKCKYLLSCCKNSNIVGSDWFHLFWLIAVAVMFWWCLVVVSLSRRYEIKLLRRVASDTACHCLLPRWFYIISTMRLSLAILTQNLAIFLSRYLSKIFDLLILATCQFTWEAIRGKLESSRTKIVQWPVTSVQRPASRTDFKFSTPRDSFFSF